MIKLLQTIPDFKGKKRLSRLLLDCFFDRGKSIKVDGKGGVSFVLPNTIENVGFEILVNGTYEQETIDFILSKLPNGAGFLDIGANIGAISIPVAKRRVDVQVIGIEASARVHDFLMKNVALNRLTNYKVLNNAVAEDNDVLVNFYGPDDKFGKGSMAPVFTKVPQVVATITIDKIWQQFSEADIQFIKIDIEGFEYTALKGGEEILSSHRAPDILLEFVDWAEELAGLELGKAQQLLFEYGYTLYKFDDQRLVQMNEPQTKGSAMIFATKKNV